VRAGEGWRGLIIAVHRTSPMTQVLVEDFTFLSCVFLSFLSYHPKLLFVLSLGSFKVATYWLLIMLLILPLI
jgi:hypothetical protein